MSMDRAKSEAGRAEANAAALRTLADQVEHYNLDTRGLDKALREFRQTAPREMPWIVLRANAVLRGIDMSPADLAAWLRQAASMQ
jgi:hypothetical protein